MSTASGDTLRDKVASKAVEQSNGDNKPVTIYDVINRQRSEIALALPKGMSPDRFARLVITQVRQTPKLGECTVPSLLSAMMLAAQLGVEPGPLGHCYLIPRYNKNAPRPDGGKGGMEVQFQLGYRGIIDLARRSGTIQSIVAREVCESDDFTFALENDPPFHHTWDPHQDRGRAYCYYGFAQFKDGGHHFLVMNLEDIERRAKRSETWGKEWSPWKSDFDAMARKTVIRAMAAYLPLSAEVARQFEVDETTRRDLVPDMAEIYTPPDYIDVPSVGAPPVGVDADTGEIDPDAPGDAQEPQ